MNAYRVRSTITKRSILLSLSVLTCWLVHANPALETSLRGPASVNAGEEVTFYLRVSNVGKTDLANIVIKLPLAAECCFSRACDEENFGFSFRFKDGDLIASAPGQLLYGPPYNESINIRVTAKVLPHAHGILSHKVVATAEYFNSVVSASSDVYELTVNGVANPNAVSDVACVVQEYVPSTCGVADNQQADESVENSQDAQNGEKCPVCGELLTEHDNDELVEDAQTDLDQTPVEQPVVTIQPAYVQEPIQADVQALIKAAQACPVPTTLPAAPVIQPTVRENKTVKLSPVTIKAVKVTHGTRLGANNGSINIEAIGGDGNYSYSIDAGKSFVKKNTFNNVAAGEYALVVKDQSGSRAQGSAKITEPSSLTVAKIQTTAAQKTAKGSLTITAQGGKEPLAYSIDNGLHYSAKNVFLNLSAGHYGVVVKDALGNKASKTARID